MTTTVTATMTATATRDSSSQNDDADQDGVGLDVEIAVPNWTGAGLGDGNGDGILDAVQPNVASLRSAVNGQYVTLVVPAGLTLVSVQAVVPSAPPPAGHSLPYGLFQFEIHNVAPGGDATLTWYIHGTQPLSSYWKYGPTSDQPSVHWYSLPLALVESAPAGLQLMIHLVDGLVGDSDLVANGIIRDPGGPGQAAGSRTLWLPQIAKGDPVGSTHPLSGTGERAVWLPLLLRHSSQTE